MSNRDFPFGPDTVWANATTSYVFFPLTSPMETRRLKLVRPAVEMCHDTTNITITAGFDLSNDMATWGNEAALMDGGGEAATIAAAGTAQGDEWIDVTSDIQAYRYVRFGVMVKNTSGGGAVLAFCHASLRLEMRDT